MNKKDIGNKIRTFRKLRGLTQFELAEAIDIHEKHLSKIENGIHFPNQKTLPKIMEVLHIDWKDFDNKTFEETNPFKNKIYKIINKATDKELKAYAITLEQLHKAFKSKP